MHYSKSHKDELFLPWDDGSLGLFPKCPLFAAQHFRPEHRRKLWRTVQVIKDILEQHQHTHHSDAILMEFASNTYISKSKL